MPAWILLFLWILEKQSFYRLYVWTSSGLLGCPPVQQSTSEDFPCHGKFSWQTIFRAIFSGNKIFSGFGRVGAAGGGCSLETFAAENVRGWTVACDLERERTVHNGETISYVTK